MTGWFVRHLRQTAEAAEAALSSRWRHDPGHAYPDVRRTPEEGARAERELARRRDGLLAAVRLAHATGRQEEAWRLCQALWTFYLRTGSHAEWIESHETGLAAARADGDRLAVARMHYQLGFARLDRWSLAEDDPRRAREHLDAARESARGGAVPGEGEARTESSALEALGLLELKLGRPGQALDLLTRAETALGGLAHPRGRALLAYHKGAAYTALGTTTPNGRCARSASGSGGWGTGRTSRSTSARPGCGTHRTGWPATGRRRRCGRWTRRSPASTRAAPGTSSRWPACCGATFTGGWGTRTGRPPTGPPPARCSNRPAARARRRPGAASATAPWVQRTVNSTSPASG
ncbi:hypothetical protein ACFQ3Z_38400 [Streptomyces nogalater]